MVHGVSMHLALARELEPCDEACGGHSPSTEGARLKGLDPTAVKMTVGMLGILGLIFITVAVISYAGRRNQ